MKVFARIESEKGFYIGDTCYVLSDKLYNGIWGDEYGYEDGVYQDPETGLMWAVASTAHGDGAYKGSDGSEFPVDAGTIGIVPLELVKDESGLEDGKVIKGAGIAEFEAEGGHFRILTQNRSVIEINTEYEEETYEDEEEP